MKKIRIATRKSALALWQAHFVKKKLLGLFPQLQVEIIGVNTQGDQQKEIHFSSLKNKDFFVKELQIALLNNDADIAVHSLKDLSAQPIEEFTLAAMLPREDPRDALLSNERLSLQNLPKGSVIGSGSPRRQSLLLHARPDLIIKPIRGNVETRIQKMQSQEFDGIILAAAGLKRLNLQDHIQDYLNPTHFVPAIGQGIITAECLSQRTELIEVLQKINDENTKTCATAERAVNQILKGGCQTPLAAHATLTDNTLHIKGVVGSLNGKQLLHAQLAGPANQADLLGQRLAQQLLEQGADKLLLAARK